MSSLANNADANPTADLGISSNVEGNLQQQKPHSQKKREHNQVVIHQAEPSCSSLSGEEEGGTGGTTSSRSKKRQNALSDAALEGGQIDAKAKAEADAKRE